MRVCGVLAPVPAGHRWFEILSAQDDAAVELHDLLVALAAIAETGAAVSLVAGSSRGLDLLEEVASHGPDVIVLAASSARWPSAAALAPRLRRAVQVPVLLYGDHARRFPEHALETAQGADCAVTAGVDALVEVINRTSLGQPAGAVAGVWSRSGPGAPRTVSSAPLPTPDWSLLRDFPALDGVASTLGLRMGSAPGPYGGPPEAAATVARSLARAARARPRGRVHAIDRSLGADLDWLTALCERPGRGGARPPWSCTLAPADVSPTVARRLAAAGCACVALDLGALGTRSSDGFAAQIAGAARLLAQANIPIRCDVVLGAPGSSQRADRAALKIAGRYAARAAVFPRLFRPEPDGPEWVAERWHPARWVEAQLQPARAVYWPRGYGSLGAVEAEWRRAWLKGAVTGPSRLAVPLVAALRRQPAAPRSPSPR